jgi:hypothetical protein
MTVLPGMAVNYHSKKFFNIEPRSSATRNMFYNIDVIAVNLIKLFSPSQSLTAEGMTPGPGFKLDTYLQVRPRAYS